ncbi:hypothetical protein IWW38_006014 [Coemansia aciculifera]|uniref:Uncharacterized protein n=1 Tax=Coemansia aciculifera TaxID=417176 RepID=A0ACC1LU52_9FUNG|nr:hypothetical protein IWW38_006014 [Coemansia aciculifera]
MVSFVCNYCQATLKKPKLDQHLQRCYNATFSCIDCNTDFAGDTYRQHTACMTEEQKYKNKMAAKKAQPPPPPPAVPKSTVDQLKEKQADNVEQATTKKRKHEKSASDKKDKTSNGWNDSPLPAAPTDALASAIAFVCQNEPGVAFKDLKKQCVKMVTKHPKFTLAKSDVKDAFDAAVLSALAEGTVALTKC